MPDPKSGVELFWLFSKFINTEAEWDQANNILWCNKPISFLSLSFYTPMKTLENQRFSDSGFLFSRGTERDQWDEIG